MNGMHAAKPLSDLLHRLPGILFFEGLFPVHTAVPRQPQQVALFEFVVISAAFKSPMLFELLQSSYPLRAEYRRSLAHYASVS